METIGDFEIIKRYLNQLARQWWVKQPESKTNAICDACGGKDIKRGQGQLVGSWLWCDECFDSEGFRYLANNPEEARVLLEKSPEYIILKEMSSQSNSSKTQSTSGCFIATATYGSPFNPQVIYLKAFRDYSLLRYKYGRLVVSLYERISPRPAAFIASRHWLRIIVRHAVVGPLLLFVKLILMKKRIKTKFMKNQTDTILASRVGKRSASLL